MLFPSLQARIAALEMELELSQKKADQMHGVLDSTKEHYEELERKYEQANQMLRNYQVHHGLRTAKKGREQKKALKKKN